VDTRETASCRHSVMRTLNNALFNSFSETLTLWFSTHRWLRNRSGFLWPQFVSTPCLSAQSMFADVL
jgi:hypothetical protein